MDIVILCSQTNCIYNTSNEVKHEIGYLSTLCTHNHPIFYKQGNKRCCAIRKFKPTDTITTHDLLELDETKEIQVHRDNSIPVICQDCREKQKNPDYCLNICPIRADQ